MTKNKIDTNSMISPWHGQENYPEIAKYAASLAKMGVEEDLIIPKVKEMYPPGERDAHLNYTFIVIGNDLIDDETVEQAYEVAYMPPTTFVALMPDAHLGYSAPIGCAASLRGAISPSLVGVDIGCMARISVSNEDVTDELIGDARMSLRMRTAFGRKRRMDITEAGRWEKDKKKWHNHPFLSGIVSLGEEQLGSSGGGNHFANIVSVDGKLGIMTHSGSRGPGAKTAKHYGELAKRQCDARRNSQPKGYEYLILESPWGLEYLEAMWIMMEYASINHACIHDGFWQLLDLKPTYHVESPHNFVSVLSSNDVEHRKGAISANFGEDGIVLGTHNTPSYIVNGLGNKEFLCSASHGAGRTMSRKEAIRRSAGKVSMTVNGDGIGPDEMSNSHKNIETVMSYQAGVSVLVTNEITTIYSLMSGA